MENETNNAAREEMCKNEKLGIEMCERFGQENYRRHSTFKIDGEFSDFQS